MIGRSWVEIDLKQLKSNIRLYQASLLSGQEIISVVKADAYGHGDVESAMALQEAGVVHFAVSNIEEGIRLRKYGIIGSILILGYTPINRLEDAVKYDIMQAIISEDYADQVWLTGLPVKVQIAIDTGMNRIGFDGENVDWCVDAIEKYANKMNLLGIFTHLAAADENEEFTGHQIDLFSRIAEKLAYLNLEYVHCLNSAGGMWHNYEATRFVRLGIVMYGLKPNYERELPAGIKPILTWKSVISMVKVVKKDEYIGYGLSYRATIDRVIATIPTGYADGYNRMLSNRGKVIVNGKKAPIVGKVCMDQFMIDVTDIVDVHVGDEVVLIGEEYSADDMAVEIGTIGYEVVCDISKRVPRIYK